MSSDAQLVRNAQDPNLYGRFVDVGRAFTQGYNQATASMSDGGNPVKAVKNNYEKQLRSYLNKLPEDVDLGAIPAKYRNNISEFLMKQKTAYVNAANTVDEYEVGSKSYMNRIAKMNTIRQSFETLDQQMKAYGENKKEMIDMIENQSISLFGENQANVNLLRGVYNEEYDMNIDEYGNVSFLGDDGAVQLNDLPGYEPKDYTIAKSMTDMAVQAYKNGVILKPGDIMYNQYKNQLKMGLDSGGVPRIMSVIHDGLVGDMPMIDIPDIQAAVQNFEAGQLSLEGLRDIVVSNYMDVIVEQSKTGYKVKQKTPSSRNRSSGGGSRSSGGTDSYKESVATYEMIMADINENVDPSQWAIPSNILIRADKDAPGTYNIVNTSGDDNILKQIDLNTAKGRRRFFAFIGIDPRIINANREDYTPSEEEVEQNKKDNLANPNS